MGGDTADLRKNTAATRQASRVGLASFETHKDEYKHNHQHDQDDPPAFSTSSSLSSSPSSHDKNADERAGDTATSTSSTSLVATNVQPKPYLSLSNLARAFNKYTRPFFPPNIMSIPTLKIGCAGLGRMGKRHADHFLHKIPRATLVAVSTPSAEELAWGKEHLEPYGVTLYSDYDEMLSHEGLQAVVIASVTTVHAEQAIKAIERDKHVLCEKPLSTSVEVSQTVVDAAKKKPYLKVLCGFSRRFDASYASAHSKLPLIGTPSVFRSQTCDKWDPTGAFVAYAQYSGGIFVDCSIHDIDLCLWFFGTGQDGKRQDVKVKSVAAVGVTALAEELRDYGDRDNAIGIVEFHPSPSRTSSNPDPIPNPTSASPSSSGGKIAYFYASRMMSSGQEDTTEIIGTSGKLSINASPQRDLVNIHTDGGIKREIPQDYFQRFEAAFVNEGRVWVDCCLDDWKVPLELESAVQAVRIGCALQEALVTGVKIEFDEGGERKVRARL